jgi:hypothetical protein
MLRHTSFLTQVDDAISGELCNEICKLADVRYLLD